ncbi:LysR substrate-binding domain-containing protein [Niabella pedocola]|uniref:LysR substrate-binding domain-containing protein n=1 Tax=Niabella pedocola TaxID=1752077 RepID=A0ABS8PY84_9BACT|nr:hydrogen peroxide-inducible genes activator [Niabella pedocola]MCD2426005.1 LysR substrate-binding domain-containing protein [Niabella pedocola]
MTLQQLEYILAVDTHRNFIKAADSCYITQPTLSMQIQKLEDELGIKIFDRSKLPVVPTAIGQGVLEHARRVLHARNELNRFIEDQKGKISGQLRIGIIPTLAPYLLPIFVPAFIKKYPDIKLIIHELMTEHIVSYLKDEKIDAGILVTPLNEAGITEHVLFYEELMVFTSKKNRAYEKQYILPKDIDTSKLWLLEEGHCFRSQILSICELQQQSREHSGLEYEAGSLETLKRMVEISDGVTIVPELVTLQMPRSQQQLIRHFKKPVPVREVSLAVHRDFLKEKLVKALREEILAAVPEQLKKKPSPNVIPIG